MPPKRIQRYGSHGDFLFKRNRQQQPPHSPQNEHEFCKWQEGLHKELQTFWKTLEELYTDDS